MTRHGQTGLALAVLVATVASGAYLVVRVATTLHTQYTLAAAVVAVCLLAAELFVAVQGLGYFWSVMKASRAADGDRAPLFVSHTASPVAVLVTSFNESAEVLEATLAAVRAMDYAAANLYVVDDSTRGPCAAAAAALAQRYGGTLVHRENRAGYKAGAINDLIPALTEPYIAVLDADQRPACSWLREIVPVLEADRRLAFVQAPQVYGNTEGLPVARGAACQQAVFYEHICEGKSASNAMFCCGSNVVFRREALVSIAVDVGGRRHYLDEDSVTEDFATSFRLHAHGWRSRYVNRTYVVGMAPETLAAYFTQQARWAMGTLAMFVRMLGQLWRRPSALRPSQWCEYLLSGMYYFVGLSNLTFMCAAAAFLLLGIMPVRLDAGVYLALFVPYVACTMGVFLAAMARRGHPAGEIWLGTALTFGTFSIFVQAAAIALLGRKRPFAVTPKAVGGRVPLQRLLPQVAMLGVCGTAAGAGLAHIAANGPDAAHVVTSAWAAYHALLLATLLLYFNRPVTIQPERPLVEPVRVAA